MFAPRRKGEALTRLYKIFFINSILNHLSVKVVPCIRSASTDQLAEDIVQAKMRFIYRVKYPLAQSSTLLIVSGRQFFPPPLLPPTSSHQIILVYTNHPQPLFALRSSSPYKYTHQKSSVHTRPQSPRVVLLPSILLILPPHRIYPFF